VFVCQKYEKEEENNRLININWIKWLTLVNKSGIIIDVYD